MKNINKYKTPQEKIMAWRRWANSESGCKMCEINKIDDETTTAYLRKLANNPYTCQPPTLLCNTTTCFNAWLHSTTEEKKGE